MFLVHSNLDNIPDCPELLPSSAKAPMNVSGVRPLVAETDVACPLPGCILPPVSDSQAAVEQHPVVMHADSAAPLLRRAADSSPPVG